MRKYILFFLALILLIIGNQFIFLLNSQGSQQDNLLDNVPENIKNWLLLLSTRDLAPINEDCFESSSDYLRVLRNPRCLVKWMQSVENMQIANIKNIEDIQLMGKRGGFIITFENKVKAYFKPCRPLPDYPGIDEDWQSEVISFHLSALLGFNRTNAAIGKLIKKDEIVPYKMSESHWRKMIDFCGTSDEHIAGSLLQWNPFAFVSPSKESIFPLYTKDNKLMKIEENMPSFEQSWILEQSMWQIFQYLIDYKKQGHNTFQLSNSVRSEKQFGPLIYLDNDRGSWDSRNTFSNTTVCQSCIFPEELIKQMKAIAQNTNFAELMKISLSMDPLNAITLSNIQQSVLNYRLASVLECVEECLKHSPRSLVLFPFDQHFHSAQIISL